MVVFPNCKINIGLNIIGKRADEYHDLQTIFYPVQIKDALEIIDAPQFNSMEFSSSGLIIGESSENNLCFKAYQLLKKDFPSLPGFKMHLHKAIPMGAGLGGGSSDAVFTLEMINKHYNLNCSQQQLKEYALLLGSDCPFFLINKPCIATGRGEILKEVRLDLSIYKILVVHPGIHINTRWAFSNLSNTRNAIDLKQVINKPVKEWHEHLVNDFETPVFESYPEIKSIKELIYASGALYASMSGSGSSVYGIFQKDGVVELNFPAHYFYKWV